MRGTHARASSVGERARHSSSSKDCYRRFSRLRMSINFQTLDATVILSSKLLRNVQFW